MDATEYKYLEDTLAGRRGRDKSYEEKMSIKPEGKFARQAEERRAVLASKTPKERELEVRRFNLQMLGRKGMERNARPFSEMDELAVPGDAPAVRVLQEHNAEQRPIVPAHLKLKGHSSGGLRYSEPITQKLQLRKG
jgi:hypothetical protein